MDDAKCIQTNILLKPAVRRLVELRASAERRSLSNFLAGIIETGVSTDADEPTATRTR
jgi:hypothetical protein